MRMRMAAAPDPSLGFFSAVCSRLRAATSSAWRRNHAEPQLELLGQDQEATVRSRLARRAGAPRRFARKLAFVSFNLELLLFVYAFWRSRRRNFNWRQPLPVLLIPALATLIYAAFVRFTRTLDLNDKKTLHRFLQHQNDSVQRGSGSHHHNSAKKSDPVDDATSFSSESDPSQTSKLGKHHLPNTNLRDDGGGGDGSWGHSKDSKPMRSDGLQQRIFSIEETHITNSSAFRQLINWSSEHLTDELEYPDYMQMTAEHHSTTGTDVAESGMPCSTAEMRSLLPGCSIAHIISNAMDHAAFSSSMGCSKSNGGPAEEDAVQTALAGPKSHMPTDAVLNHEVVVNGSSEFHASEDMPFISDKELLVSSYAVKNIERHSRTSGFTFCYQETEKEDVAGGFSSIKVSPELRLLSSPELAVDVEGGKDADEKESCELDNKEENDVAVNSEEEALLGIPEVNTSEPDYGTSGFSLRAQDSNIIKVPAVINIFSIIPESNHPASVELLAENYDDSMDAETSDLHLPEQKGQENFLDPLVVDSFEDSFATSEFLLRSAAAEMTKVLGVAEEALSEGRFNHQNDVVASSDGGGDTENVISDSVSIQLIPEANIMEALQGGQETLSDALHHSSFHSGIFLSSSEISNDEACSSNSNSYTSHANSVENEEPIASKGGGSGSKDKINSAILDTSILSNEVTNAKSWTDNTGCSRYIPESNRTQSLHDGKQILPTVSERVNFCLEESLISLDQEINLEIFSLYSRSSSCVSEVNMTEILRSGTFPASGNDDRTSMMVPNMKHVENYANNAMSTEFIPEINMTETLNVGKEATARLENEVSSNFGISLKAPEVGNIIENFDNSDLLLWSFDPVVDASEGLQEDSLVYPDEVFVSDNNPDIAKLLLCPTEVSLIESLDDDQRGTDQQQDETNLVSEDMYMECQGSTSENSLNNLEYQHISDVNMTKTLQGAGRLSPDIFHDGIFCIAGASVSLDGGNARDNSSANSGSVMDTAQNNTVVLLGLQGLEKAMVSISQDVFDSAEKNGSDSICTEAVMTGAIQGVNKSPSQSQDELLGTYVSTVKANHPEYPRSSSSEPDDNLIELAARQERYFDHKDENPSSFKETSPPESLSNNLMCASHCSKKESVSFSVTGFPDPSLEDAHDFDKVSGNDHANKS